MIAHKKLLAADVGWNFNKTKSYLNGGSFFIHKICSYAINSKPEADANRVKKAWEEGQNMTRDDARKSLIGLGIAEPDDSQITNFLNQINGATKSERDRAEKFRTEAEKVTDLQKQLDEINSKGLSDVERANKATEDALKKVAELEKNIKTMQTQKQLAELGIVGESADKFFDSEGNVDFSVLGQILSETKKNAATEKEKELAGNAGNPGGQGGASSTSEKTDDVKFAEGYAKRVAESNKAQSDAMASYLK